MKVLILGLNYAPELVGIAPYTTDLARWLAAQGHEITVVSAKPYYPTWRTDPTFGRGYLDTTEADTGVRVIRCPLYVPRRPSGAKRIIHHLSFLASTLRPMLKAARSRPDVVIAIAPSLVAAPVARLAAKRARAPSWLHIQDFEVGAALATGLLKPGSMLARFAARFERAALSGHGHYSSISPQMCARLIATGVPETQVSEVRNWSDIDAIHPIDRPSAYRRLWGIEAPHVALYSGNIANKQGVHVIVEAARRLRHRNDLLFIVCGEGPSGAALRASARDLGNIRFEALQPQAELNELLNLATVHLLPQLAGAADLVLPSKLTNMLASGRPVVATADPKTGLYEEVLGCGEVVPPGDADAFAAAIARLIDDPERWRSAAAAARTRAEQRWAKAAILPRIERDLAKLVAADLLPEA